MKYRILKTGPKKFYIQCRWDWVPDWIPFFWSYFVDGEEYIDYSDPYVEEGIIIPCETYDEATVVIDTYITKKNNEKLISKVYNKPISFKKEIYPYQSLIREL